jgi:hypothetical protein
MCARIVQCIYRILYNLEMPDAGVQNMLCFVLKTSRHEIK